MIEDKIYTSPISQEEEEEMPEEEEEIPEGETPEEEEGEWGEEWE